MIIAQYTIRSKQDYIYKTNKILEIMGASEHISKSWDVLFEQANKIGLKTKRADGIFNFDEIKRAFQNRTLDMVELFAGGGNDTILFRDKTDDEENGPYLSVNRAFSYYLLENYPGLIPMAVCQNVSEKYRYDYAQLMKKSEEEKSRMISGADMFVMPFTMMDRDTFQPLTDIDNEVRYSKERLSKRKSGIECRNNDDAVKLLDDMTTKRGEESLLAVVHADGNNMGSKIMQMLGDKDDYDYCVNAMRRFSNETTNAFVDYGLDAMKKCKTELMDKYGGLNKYRDNNGKIKERIFTFRRVIADGDDMTFICNARFAMEYTKAYLQAIRNYKNDKGCEWDYSSCAGICIFHSHYSFAEAYRLAEKACDDCAKDKVHRVDSEGKIIPAEEGWVDFHYIHSSVGGDLLTIRENQGTLGKMARPWCVTDDEKNNSYSKLIKLADIFSRYKVTRTDIKTMGMDWENSSETGYITLSRVFGHHNGLEKEIESLKWNKEQILKSVYDLAEIYDLWFAEV